MTTTFGVVGLINVATANIAEAVVTFGRFVALITSDRFGFSSSSSFVCKNVNVMPKYRSEKL